MSQWGATRTITDFGTTIRVTAHVNTGENPFNPIASEDKVDLLLLVNVEGSKDVANTIMDRLNKQFVNKAHSIWMRA